MAQRDPRDPRVLRVPDPSLVVLVGAAGSGKSTFAARHFAPDEILSSDAFRAAISGDAADQSASPAAFKALHAALDRRLRDGRLTVVDATNLTAAARQAARDPGGGRRRPGHRHRAGPAGAVVLARNAARRDRVVPEDVVRRHLGEVRIGSWRMAELDRRTVRVDRHAHRPAEVERCRSARWSVAAIRSRIPTPDAPSA